MRIMFISKGRSDINKWVNIAKLVQKEVGNQLQVVIVTACDMNLDIPDWIEIVDAYSTFDSFKLGCANLNESDIGNKLMKLSSYVSPSAYRSDMKYIYRSEKERNLGLEQLYITKKSVEIIQKYQPTLLFVAGAGTLIRTVFFSVACSLNIDSFRVLRAHHMNKDRKGVRYFFCDNDLGGLPVKNTKLLNHNDSAIEEYAKNLIDDIKSRTHQFDKYSRSVGRYWRVSKPGIGFLKDTAKYVYHSIKNKDNLSKKTLEYKITCRFRAMRQNHLFMEPSELKGKFVLFSLNVPVDAQLRLRAKEYSNTEGVIGLLASNLPLGYTLAVKLHPGNPGMLSTGTINRIRKKFNNVVFLSHEVSLFEQIKRCTAVVIINGNSTIESAIMHKPCIYLGSAYLSKMPNCFKLSSFGQLEAILTEIESSQLEYKDSDIGNVLQDFYKWTFPLITKGEGKAPTNRQEIMAQGISEIVRSTDVLSKAS